MTSAHNPTKAVLWMLLTTFCFVLFGVVIKFVGDGLPTIQAAFLRFALGLVFLLPMLQRIGELQMTHRLWRLTAARAVFQSLAMATWFYAILQIPLAEVTAINFLNPIYVAIGAIFFFREKVAWPRLIALGVAFVGAFIVLRPGFRDLSPGHLSVMITAICLAASYLIAKSMTGKLSPAWVVTLLSASVPIVLFPFAVAVWERPTLEELGLLFVAAFLATLAHYAMTQAFTRAPQSVVQPVVFVQLIWASAAGYLIFDEAVDIFVLIGGAVIGGAVSFVTWREAMKKRAEGRNASEF